MKIMSQSVLELTKKSIDEGFQNHNNQIIEKETDYIIGKILSTFLSLFSDKVSGISLGKPTINFDSSQLLTDKHKKELKKWLNRINMGPEISDLDFGKLKVDFENWYIKIGGESICFQYKESYLLTPQEAADRLGVSKVTLNKYIKQGFECVKTTSHHKIPKHMVELWKDPVYAIRCQLLFQNEKISRQKPDERLSEINEEITEFQIKYGAAAFNEAFKNYNGDETDDPTDYYRWRDLEEERNGIIHSLSEHKNEW